ncbi:MAG: PAS domain S-box protein [Desulfatibacillaceae bacterium]
MQTPRCFRTILVSILTALVAVALVSGGAFAAERSPRQETVSSASEIDYPPFCLVNERGEADGFSVELLRAALAAMGREVTFRTGPWVEVKAWLEKGEIDALPLVGRTPEREELFDFTFPYMTLHGAIVVREGTRDIRTLEDLEGKQVATMIGDNAEEFLRRKERGIDIRTTLTFEQALAELTRGEHDAVFMQRLVALRLIDETGVEGLRVLDNPVEEFSQDFCFAVREGDRETLALLNEGLALVMADGTYRHLHARWFAALELPADRRVIVGGDHNYPPYEYLDENGRPAGYNVDLTRAIARELGLEVEIRLGPWSRMREQLATGRIDALQGMLYSPERDVVFDFTPPHIVNHYVCVARKGGAEALPERLEQLRGRDIVVQAGDIMHDFAVENGLADRLTMVDAQEVALRELAEGRHDYALVSRLTALYWIDEKGWNNLEVGRHPFLSPGYCYAVPKNHRALLAHLSEGLRLIEESGEYRRIYEKWMGVYEEPDLADTLRHTAYVVVPLLVLLAVILLWSWSLRRQVAARTRELRRSEEQYRLLADNTLDVIWTMDVNLVFTYVNPAIRQVTGHEPGEWVGTRLSDHSDEANFEKMARAVTEEIDRWPDNKGVIFEAEMLRRDGSPIPVEIHGRVFFDQATGEPLSLQGTTRDISERKQAEGELRLSHLVLEQIKDHVVVTDLDGYITYVNDATSRVHGRPPEEMVGQPVSIFGNDPSTGTTQEKIHRHTLANGEWRGEITNYRPDGTPVYLDLRTHVVRDEDGRPAALCGISTDVTKQKLANEKLRESEKRFSMAFHTSPYIITITRARDERFVEVNDAFVSKSGYSREEALSGSTIGPDIWGNPGDRDAVVADLMAGKTVTDREYLFRKKSGELMTGLFSAQIMHLDGEAHILSSINDITEWKWAEQELHEALMREKEVVRAANVGLFDWDILTGEVRYSDEWKRQIGFEPHEIANDLEEWRSRVHPEDLEPVMARIEQSLARGSKNHQSEFRLRHKDGSWRWILAQGSVVRDEDGRPVRMRGSHIDITQRKKAEEEKARLEAQIHQSRKMESIGRLAGGVAHDYNNMLNVIIGYAELAMDRLTPRDSVYPDLEEILSAAKRSVEITRQLLAFARKQTVAPKMLDLNGSVESMLKILQRLIGEDIDFSWSPGAGLWKVRIDPAQVDQILANLCVNARDAIGGVGSVAIETENVVLDECHCVGHPEFSPGEYVMLSVTDSGKGMDADTLQNVFEPFFTTKGLGKGTGLGLATVYGIVKQNKGFIDVDSEPGKGATFRVYLPRYSGQTVGEAGDVEVEISPARGETVLLVEDETAMLDLGARMLKSLDYEVLPASTPGKALELAEQYSDRIDLLITDVVMPEMNGRALADKLRSQNPDLEVLFMSGHSADVIAHRGLLETGVNFIQKPFTRKDLAIKVRAILD